MVSLDEMADRPPRPLADGETIELGAMRVRHIDTPHVPHGWEARVLYEETTGTLLCGDLFTQLGDGPALTEDDIVGPAGVAEDAFALQLPGARPRRRRSRQLADLAPTHARAHARLVVHWRLRRQALARTRRRLPRAASPPRPEPPVTNTWHRAGGHPCPLSLVLACTTSPSPSPTSTPACAGTKPSSTSRTRWTPLTPAASASFSPIDAWELVIVLHRHDTNDSALFGETTTGLDHVGLAVAGRADLEAWQAHLEANGVVRSDTADRPLTQSPIANEAYGSVLVFRDPDNIQLELFAPPGA